MAKKNFYGVRVGKIPGIYGTWEECQSQINGVSGAVFKGFATKEEAEAFVGENPQTAAETKIQRKEITQAKKEVGIQGKEKTQAETGTRGGCDIENGMKEPMVERQEDTEAVAYVDGSYDAGNKAFSYGIVFFYGGREQHFSQKITDSDLAEMHNVAGEIQGAQKAMEYCLERQIASITIYHDYEGIAKWCTGEWRAKKTGTIAYAEFFKKASKQLKVRFVKVKGHAGDEYNELADKLARQALDLEW